MLHAYACEKFDAYDILEECLALLRITETSVRWACSVETLHGGPSKSIATR